MALVPEIGVPPLDAEDVAERGGERGEPAAEQEEGKTEEGPGVQSLHIEAHDDLVDGLAVCHEPVRGAVDDLMGDIVPEKHAPLEHVGSLLLAFPRIPLDARSNHLGEFSNGCQEHYR